MSNNNETEFTPVEDVVRVAKAELNLELATHQKRWLAAIEAYRSSGPRTLLLTPRAHGASSVACTLALHRIRSNPARRVLVVANDVGHIEYLLSILPRDIAGSDSRLKFLPWFNAPARVPADVRRALAGAGDRFDVVIVDRYEGDELAGVALEWLNTTLEPRATDDAEWVLFGTHDSQQESDIYTSMRTSERYRVLCDRALTNVGATADAPQWRALWPEQWPVSRLEELRQGIGPAAFQRMYQHDASVLCT